MLYKVVVVDDEVEIRNGIAKFINRFSDDFEVTKVLEDGRDAIAYLSAHRADLIISDIKMSDIDGIELCKYIHEHFPDTKMIVLSGYSNFDYAQQLMKSGVSLYLLKPLDKAKLLEALSKVKSELDEKAHIAKQIECRKHMVNIIFITNRNELVFDALHYRPFRFIRKERLLQELEEALLSVLEEIKQQTMYCEMEVGVNMVQICVSDVLYLESSGHYVIIHREDGRQEVLRAKISEFAKKLEKYGFLRVHVGYLVNVRNIYAINSKEIRLDNQEHVPVSRKYLEQVRRQHANYVRRMLFGIS